MAKCDMEFLQLCLALESVEETDDYQLCKYKEALEKIVARFQESSCKRGPQEEDLIRVLVLAAGHSGSHYWTTPTTTRLANGEPICHTSVHTVLFMFFRGAERLVQELWKGPWDTCGWKYDSLFGPFKVLPY